MTQDVEALPGGSRGRQYSAWDGTVWPDRDSRDVHNHTHPSGSLHPFAPLRWSYDDLWGSIKR